MNVNGKKIKASVPEEFQLEMLKIHNAYREKHSAPPLSLDPELCALAQQWAIQSAEKGELKYRQFEYGENMYSLVKKENCLAEAQEACSNWYNEYKKFKQGVERRDSRTNHFTQLVWKSTTQLGVGRAEDKIRTFIVANYHPMGNIEGEFKDNVHVIA